MSAFQFHYDVAIAFTSFGTPSAASNRRAARCEALLHVTTNSRIIACLRLTVKRDISDKLLLVSPQTWDWCSTINKARLLLKKI